MNEQDRAKTRDPRERGAKPGPRQASFIIGEARGVAPRIANVVVEGG